jgi:hypothetical protein
LATLPLSILYRAQWATVGHYTFPVTDWKNGSPEWSGTVTYTKTTQWNEAQTPGGGVRRRDYKEVLSVNVNVTGTAEGSGAFGAAGAQLSATAQAQYTMHNTSSWSQPARCGRIVGQFRGTTLDSTEGSGSGTAKVVVGISGDGKYSISVNPEVTLAVTTNYGNEQSAPDGGNQCQPRSQSTSSSHAGTSPIGADIIQGDGTIDPRTPDRLSGTTTEREGNTTRTITWNLQRH